MSVTTFTKKINKNWNKKKRNEIKLFNAYILAAYVCIYEAHLRPKQENKIKSVTQILIVKTYKKFSHTYTMNYEFLRQFPNSCG